MSKYCIVFLIVSFWIYFDNVVKMFQLKMFFCEFFSLLIRPKVKNQSRFKNRKLSKINKQPVCVCHFCQAKGKMADEDGNLA